MIIHNTLKISLFIVLLLSSAVTQAELSTQRKQQLEHLLKHDCGSCHGMTLKGGLGPSLLEKRLKNLDDEFLFLTIKHGRPGTPMPPWKTLLTDNEIHWLIHLLRTPNPDE